MFGQNHNNCLKKYESVCFILGESRMRCMDFHRPLLANHWSPPVMLTVPIVKSIVRHIGCYCGATVGCSPRLVVPIVSFHFYSKLLSWMWTWISYTYQYSFLGWIKIWRYLMLMRLWIEFLPGISLPATEGRPLSLVFLQILFNNYIYEWRQNMIHL